jgi:hypothetical protein
MAKNLARSYDHMLKNNRKCDYCTDRKGEKKMVYETEQLAISIAENIRKERGTCLNVYECEHGNGWHLTENQNYRRSFGSMILRPAIPLQNEEIDEDDQFDEDILDRKLSDRKYKNDKPIPIKKIECESEANIIICGKVSEIVEEVDIEKTFDIDMDNMFVASAIKNIFDGVVSQITIYVENKENNQLDSYTVLIKKELLRKNKITKGCQIKVNIIGKIINNIKRWYCLKILKGE